MALINCPECSKEISDKVKTCFHCGYPLTDNDDTQKVEVTSVKLRIDKDNTYSKVPFRGTFLLEGEILMLYINDKLPITQQDLQYFIGKWFQYADDETMNKKEHYRFRVVDDIIFVEFVTTHTYDGGMSTEYNQVQFVKMQTTVNKHPTYHSFYRNRQIILDGSIFLQNAIYCQHLQKKLEVVK